MPSNAKNVRRCCVCHEHADKSQMIRFVRNKDGEVFLDNTKSADGRGVWVHKDGDCIAKMIKKKTLNAAFRQSVNESLYEELRSYE